MKVFWAWQSDLSGKISRHFIRGVLEEAIKQLNQVQEIDEPDERLQSAGFELDHDRKNLAGSPDLANEILKKIEAAAVFVGDVTPVGKTAPRKNAEGREFEKKLMNPNVAIELGYALKGLDTSRILMIMNAHFGERADMPFDLGHKGAPIMYKLAPDAKSEEIEREKIKLVKTLVEALGMYTPKPVQEPFVEMKPQIGGGIFFKDGEILGQNINEPGMGRQGRRFIMSARRIMWLRLFPIKGLSKPMAEDSIRDSIGRLGSFGTPIGMEGIRDNSYGFVYFSWSGNEIDSLSQYTRDGQVWGINAEHLRHELQDKPIVIWNCLEDEFIRSLPRYCEYMQRVANVSTPIWVEAGIEGIKGLQLVHTGMTISRTGAPKMYEDKVVERAVLKSYDQGEQLRFLERFLKKVHDNSGVPRPQGLYGRW